MLLPLALVSLTTCVPASAPSRENPYVPEGPRAQPEPERPTSGASHDKGSGAEETAHPVCPSPRTPSAFPCVTGREVLGDPARFVDVDVHIQGWLVEDEGLHWLSFEGSRNHLPIFVWADAPCAHARGEVVVEGRLVPLPVAHRVAFFHPPALELAGAHVLGRASGGKASCEWE